ncbi:MetQ/NlpA family ABC transporter substrate-binding protein [Geminicoccaceae bacterium 1502E]|nr:MetQ/NlpA family ABC transporter substrate-binding protein [Geminicoccaceae bacterium 1502E]
MTRIARRALLGAAAALALLAGPAGAAERIKVGVTPGPHAQIMEKVAEIAAGKDLEIEIIEFSDYVLPNAALAAGDLDANSFQHQPYLDRQVEDRGYDLVAIARNVNFPMGIYSKKVGGLAELPEGARVGIPNDPTNGGRALALLASGGVIGLPEGLGHRASVLDITDNPKNLRIVEIDAAQLPRSLDDLDAAAVNTNYAVEAGMSPVEDSILIEPKDSPYANLIVVRADEKDREVFKTLVESYHNDEVRAFIAETFKGAVVAAW